VRILIKPINFQEINQDYIESLIESGIEESLHLDYKESLGSNAEIAKDISSFANSDGGNIIYGIIEEKNKPIGIKLIKGRDVRERIDQITQF
jgi:predicted HTH transcriptional regulator